MSETWRIGALARATGLSIRALRHYEALGLLKPSHRSRAGHRLYSRCDVQRLQQVQSLKQLGFARREIGDCLGTRRMSPHRILELHLDRARAALAAHQKLVARLELLKDRLEKRKDVPIDEFIRAVQAITMTERYFTTEQQELIRRRREMVGEDRMRQVEQHEWPQLIADVRAAMDAGVAPSSSKRRDEHYSRLSAGSAPRAERAASVPWFRWMVHVQCRRPK
jgi:MerR family transcriptional regulator, thiopeptide resistance regulator